MLLWQQNVLKQSLLVHHEVNNEFHMYMCTSCAMVISSIMIPSSSRYSVHRAGYQAKGQISLVTLLCLHRYMLH